MFKILDDSRNVLCGVLFFYDFIYLLISGYFSVIAEAEYFMQFAVELGVFIGWYIALISYFKEIILSKCIYDLFTSKLVVQFLLE